MKEYFPNNCNIIDKGGRCWYYKKDGFCPVHDKELKEQIDVCVATNYGDFNWSSRWGIPLHYIILSDKKGLANARNELMQKVTTEWFLFLDDDVCLNKQWWEKIKVHMSNPNIGAIQGFPLTNNIFLNILRKILLLRGTKHQRGFTSNTLIRKKAVEGITLEREGRLEDLELQEKIKAKGYGWKFVRAYCYHLADPKRLWKDSLDDFNRLRKERSLWKALLMI